MVFKLRLLASALFLCALALGWKALALMGAGSHFGSPALQICSLIDEPVNLARACDLLRTQVDAMSAQYDEAFQLTGLASVFGFFLGAAALTLSFEMRKA
ncbi:MAG TPA: hypothetical protein VIT62_16555 [Lysobacter sp.]